MEQLRDIATVVEVPDASLWLLSGLILGAAALAAALLFWLLRRRRGRTDRRRAEALRRLEALDYGDTKEAVYAFTLLARYTVTPGTETALEPLLKELEIYKYKKEVPGLAPEHRERMEAFVREVRHG